LIGGETSAFDFFGHFGFNGFMTHPWFQSYPKGVATEINLQGFKSVQDLIQSTFEKSKNNPAFSNMDFTLSYEKLDQLSTQFAVFLQQELKLKKGDKIALQMPNLLQFPVALMGALKAGLVIVNTNPLYTPRELEHQLKDSQAVAIVVLANFAHNLESILKKTKIESVIVTEVGDLLPFPKNWLTNTVVKRVKKMVPAFSLPQAYQFNQALALGKNQKLNPVPCTLQDLAFLQYTGGTTGVSKGAMLTHENVLSNMFQIVDWMSPSMEQNKEVIITALPMYHIFSLTVNTLAFMYYGAHNILVTNPRDIPAFIKLLQKTSFTVVTGVNTLYNALMNHPDFGKINFSKVKISVAGAMALQKSVADRWREKTNSPIFEGYGLTEASPVLCCNPVIESLARLGTIGVPLPSTHVKIVDENFVEVKLGQEGEVVAKGPQIMKGYYNRPEETEKTIHQGWLKTGDIGVQLDKGFFKIVDRKKDMILVSGFNVYPNEIEEIVSMLPGVLEVAAIGVSDENCGEVPKIFVVKRDPNLTEKEIIDHCRKNLTGYKIPKQVEFRKDLPKTNVGKILRRELR
jgi:long-chain acyl-CoA synthetase